ncbi:hypothetical protein [Neolewinella antarctica]|uniref:Lipoprotein n=1 Tax=Neolewinella antarctica TaxID=442734 RepID=A0ABX0XBH5_9BACT|nr:hypothetical protein [Neolewinella antarctica]NJC26610.1 hypothetical protein [Neolewinella antarctica]
MSQVYYKMLPILFGVLGFSLHGCLNSRDELVGAYCIEKFTIKDGSDLVNLVDCLKSNKIAFNKRGKVFIPGFLASVMVADYVVAGDLVQLSQNNECYFDSTLFYSFQADTLILSSNRIEVKCVRESFNEKGSIKFDMFDRKHRQDLWNSEDCIRIRSTVCDNISPEK